MLLKSSESLYCVFMRKLVKLPSENKDAYSGFVVASMSVQPVSSVLCQIPLKKENFCRSELFFFLWVFFARGWSGFIIGNAAPVCNVGRLAVKIRKILTNLTEICTPLKLALQAETLAL